MAYALDLLSKVLKPYDHSTTLFKALQHLDSTETNNVNEKCDA